MLYWGFDLGDGESAVARVSGEGLGAPEIVEIDGRKARLRMMSGLAASVSLIRSWDEAGGVLTASAGLVCSLAGVVAAVS